MKQLMLAAGVAALGFSGAAQAATLSFTLSETRGEASTDTDVVLTDIEGGVNLQFTVNDPVNYSDLVAVYFNLDDAFDVSTLTIPLDAPVTGVEFQTRNVVAGNIGELFDVGIAIGDTGSGVDFFDSFSFNIFGLALDISDFFGQTFAVRGQTVGPVYGTGEDSSKEFGMAGIVPDMTPVPLPAAGWLLMAALGGLVVAGRRKAA